LYKKTSFTSAVSWSILDQFGVFFVNLLITAVLARLIPPSEFGLLAMVTVITGFLGIFKNFGLNASLIHKQNITDEDINTVFWFTTFITAFLATIIIISAPWISKFYDNPRLTSITIAMGILFFISSLGSIPDALIRKELLFKVFFYRNITNKILSGLIGILLAYKGFGVWALIANRLISSIYITWISFKMVKWRPQLYFNIEILKPHLNYSMPLLGLKILNYWSSNIDTLLVGKYFGATLLGYYNKSYSLMLLPVRKISGSVSRVVFPTFSKMQNDLETLWKKYLKLMSITAYITFPMMGVMYLLADVIILTVYGPNWKPAITYFKAFSFIGAIQSLTYTGTIFQSIGKTKKVFYLNIVLKSLVIIGILIGLYKGNIMGVIWGFTIGSLIAFVINIYFLSKEFSHSLWDIVKSFYREFLLTIIIVVILQFIILYFNINNRFHKFVLVILIGGIIYVILSIKLKIEGYIFIKSKIRYFFEKFH